MDDDSDERSTLRRASEPFGGTDVDETRFSSSQQLPARVPLPLPYLPSDYEPSSTSPSHRILFRDNLDFGTSTSRQVSYPPMVRQRSRSADRLDSSRRSVLAIESSQLNENHSYELVPYREWTVISRNDDNGQVVLYNPESRMVTVRRSLPDRPSPAGSSAAAAAGSVQTPFQFGKDECPYCHRPFPRRSHAEDMSEPNYMDRNYFRLLASSPIHSPAASRHGTPHTTRQNISESSPAMDESMRTSTASHIRLNANAFNQGYYEKFFVEKKKLGRGFRGSVFLCEHELDGVKLGKYAVKKVAIGNNHPWLVKMLREVHLLERLRHPNIVSYKHAWLEYHRPTPFGPEIPCLFILMECANGGNLEEYMEPEIVGPTAPSPEENSKDRNLAKKKKRERIKRQLQQEGAGAEQTDAEHPAPTIHTQKRLLSIPEIRSFFLDIVEGLAHLHQQNIVHRDLKPPNLLLKWDNRNHDVTDVNHKGLPRVLISDFGECEDLEDVPDKDRTGATGTLEFMAPEHVRFLPGEKHMREYSPKADMWSLGMVLYYLCYTTLPYSNVDDVDLLRKEILELNNVEFPESRFDIYNGLEKTMDPSIVEAMRRQNVPADIPQEYKILIRMLLSRDPDKRPSCEKILSQVRQLRPPAPKYHASIDDDFMSATTSKWSESIGTSRFGNSNGHDSGHASRNSHSSNGSSTYGYALESRHQQRPSWQQIESMPGAGLRIHSLPPTEPMDVDDDENPSQTTISPFDSPETILTAGHHRKSVKRDNQNINNNGCAAVKRRKKHRSITPPPSSSSSEENEPLLLEPVYTGTSNTSSHFIKMITVIIKVASTAYHCYPYLPKDVVLYPILLFALLDFKSDGLSHSLLLVFLHVIWILLVALFTGSICVLPA